MAGCDHGGEEGGIVGMGKHGNYRVAAAKEGDEMRSYRETIVHEEWCKGKKCLMAVKEGLSTLSSQLIRRECNIRQSRQKFRNFRIDLCEVLLAQKS